MQARLIPGKGGGVGGRERGGIAKRGFMGKEILEFDFLGQHGDINAGGGVFRLEKG